MRVNKTLCTDTHNFQHPPAGPKWGLAKAPFSFFSCSAQVRVLCLPLAQVRWGPNACKLRLVKGGPQIPVSPLTWMMTDLGLAGQRELLLNKARAVVVPVLCSLETPEKQQPWCLRGEQMAPCSHGQKWGHPWKAALIKVLLQRHGCLWFQQPFFLGLFLFSAIAKYHDPYFDCFNIGKCIVKNKITKKRKNCSTH